MGFPRQEYWSGLPFPSPEDLPDPGIELMSPELAGRFSATEPPKKPYLLTPNSKLMPPPVSCSNYKFNFYICESISVLLISSSVSWTDSTYKHYHVVSVLLWLISLTVTISRSIHVATNGINLFFLWLKSIPLCVCVYIAHLFIHVNRYLGCFQVLAIVNRAAMNTGVHASSQIRVFSVYKPRSVISGSYDKSFSFFRNLHTVIHSRCTILHFPNSIRWFPFFICSPAFIICRLLNQGHSNQYEVIPHYEKL